jgi:hypothetical protein
MVLPLNREQVGRAASWLLTNFGPEIEAAVAGKPYDKAVVCAIACKETGAYWVSRTGTLSPKALLGLQVGDASGDLEGTARSAFPRNTQAFRDRFGDELTAMLIEEANKARAVRGFSPRQWVYKGYGLFQYDLQHVLVDEAFFREKQWYTIGPCLARMQKVLDRTFIASGGEERGAVRRYNGTGPRAEEYADHVMTFIAWCRGKG